MRLFPSPLAFSLVAVLMVVDAIWLLITPIDLDLRSCQPTCYSAAALTLVLVILMNFQTATSSVERFRGNAARFVMGVIFILAGWTTLRLFNHLTMTTALPYTDAFLATIDRTLHLGWFEYFAFVQKHWLLLKLLEWSYTALAPVSIAAFAFIFVIRGQQAAGRFLEGFFLTAFLCTIIGPLFPAKGATAFFADIVLPLNVLDRLPGTYAVAATETLRAGGRIVLNVRELPGLVTFPSFHTAAAVIVAAGFWRTKLFVPVAVYSAIVIASTPIFGGHYFIDLIGGALVAVAAIAAIGWKAAPVGQLHPPRRSAAAVTVTSAGMLPRSAARTQAAPD